MKFDRSRLILLENQGRNEYSDGQYPAAEVERFCAFNDAHGWSNTEGRPYDTPEKRLGLARLWEFKAEGQWARPDYLQVVKNIYQSACQDEIEGVEALINHRVTLVWDGRQNKWFWKATPEARQWVVKNQNLVHKFLDPITLGRTVTWEMIKAS